MRIDGAKLRELRYDMGMTQEELASVAGSAPETLSRIENEGNSRRVTDRILRGLASALRVPIVDLLGEEE
jgi:transcriptional regulator with XRE-family HTH domain